MSLERTKLIDLEQSQLAQELLIEGAKPDLRLPVVASPDSAASLSHIWRVRPTQDAVDAIVAAGQAARTLGVRWHRVNCDRANGLQLAGTAALPASAGREPWPADVLLSVALSPSARIGTLEGPYYQLRIDVERGLPTRGRLPSVDAAVGCPSAVADVLR